MRSLGQASFALLALAASGCTHVLDLGGSGDAGPGADAALDDDASSDAGGGGCAAPSLIVGLRSVSVSVDNAIARFGLGAGGWERCGPDLVAESQLPPVQTVGWIDADRIVVGSDRGIWLVDARTDRLLGERFFLDPPSVDAVDAFGLRDSAGVAWGAVAADYRLAGPGIALDRFYFIRPDTMEIRIVEIDDVDTIRLTGCDASPADDTAIVCTEPIRVAPPYGTEAAAKEIHPWDAAPATPWIAPLAGTELRRLDALGDRIVWIGNTADADHVRRSVGPATSGTVSGPLRCSTALCGSPWELEDVAVDPSRPGGYFAICRGVETTDTRYHVIRGDADADGAPCEVLIDGTTLPSGVDPMSLDVRAP